MVKWTERDFDSPIVRWGLRIAGFIFVAASLGAIAVTILELSEHRESQSWPSVRGRILRSELTELEEWSKRGSKKKHYLQVSYGFLINGLYYQGDRIAIQPLNLPKEQLLELQRRYSVGTEHDVYYDPAKPSRALLIPGGDVPVWKWLALFGIALFGVLLMTLQPIVRRLSGRPT